MIERVVYTIPYRQQSHVDTSFINRPCLLRYLGPSSRGVSVSDNKVGDDILSDAGEDRLYPWGEKQKKTPDIGLPEIYFKPYQRLIWEYLERCIGMYTPKLEGIESILTFVEWFLNVCIQNLILSCSQLDKAELITKDSAGSSDTRLSTKS